jgi:D-tagatose-1,6-bisphosphate aldolase subunit GatZ/KbaZ
MIPTSPLSEVIAAQKRGESKGIASICSANPWVIRAMLQQAQATGEPVLIESTCNQVNQFGGYTGWTPAQFVAYLQDLTSKQDFPFEQIVIGGDHLGPSPWQDEPVAVAMEKAKMLVRECVLAGYSKIHLDASMKCADDDPNHPLDSRLSAARAAELARVAEKTFSECPSGSEPAHYVIGTEVPLPGGAQEQEEALSITTTSDVAETIEVTKEAFLKQGLELAWQRVIAVVVQPGVEYGDASLFEYNRTRAADLARYIEGFDGLLYEAHSTDYQLARALRQLVEDHFAILKVGPALTFALREGIYALACIEEELLAGNQLVEDHFAILKVGPALTFALREGIYALACIEEELLAGNRDAEPSQARERLDEAMLANPVYWQKYYHGDAQALHLARKYSFSDRSRYYWPVPKVQFALTRLLQNLGDRPLPLTLLSQYVPVQYGRIRSSEIANDPQSILLDKVRSVLSDYSYACGY